ncbi:hypothetical protein [Streptomyces sp. NPDC048551]|uniref:hypothetical protein n=1 Tax=Streptomyces sp. NPDC048551 TaxID=3155758 RepID=UPI0034376ECD
MKITVPDEAPWYCGAYTFLPLDAVETHRRINGRDLSNYMVECVRDQGHEDEHSGTIRGSGAFRWEAERAIKRRADVTDSRLLWGRVPMPTEHREEVQP